MRYTCCDERRLRAVKEAGVLNGIEYLEVSRLRGAARRPLRQRTLFVRLLQPPGGLTPEANVAHRGRRAHPRPSRRRRPTRRRAGRRSIAGLDDPATVLLVTHRLDGRLLALHAAPRRRRRQRRAAGRLRPAARRRSSSRSRSSARPTSTAAAPARARRSRADAPAIDYLAKDYDSFRRLMLDRLSLLAPDWTERTPADLGRRARRAARVRRRRAVVPPGRGRHRGVPRHRAPAHLAAPPRAARRLRRARGRERARLGARDGQRRGACALAEGHARC